MAGIGQIIVIVLDSVGIGGAPDASVYGDDGSNTIGNIAEAVGELRLPNLALMGLGHLGQFKGVPPVSQTRGAYGVMTEKSRGKDSISGHWELAGLILDKPFPTFPNGFPHEFIQAFEARIGRGTLGNVAASGTEIIERLGVEHLSTGCPIIYTSADSVFQIAAHDSVISLSQLYKICEEARELLVGEWGVGRVIARPFTGTPGQFRRTDGRKDFSRVPLGQTILDVAKASGLMVAGVGKIGDIFAERGLTSITHTSSNDEGINATIQYIETREPGLIFSNLVDFDTLYGHRNDPSGYASALEMFDSRVGEIINALSIEDILILTADHGNDPTTPSTDHSREQVPILVMGGDVTESVSIGVRETFADLAATIAQVLQLDWHGPGQEFWSLIRKGIN